MSGGGKPPRPDTYAQEKQAQVAREQWDDYLMRYRPLENELQRETDQGATLRSEIADVDKYTGMQLDQAKASGMRMAQNYGGMTAEQQAAADRRLALGGATTRVGLRNATRRMVTDRNIGLRQRLIEVNRGIAGDASKGFGTLAALEAQRNSTNASIAASNRAATMGMVGTAVGVGAAAIVF